MSYPAGYKSTPTKYIHNCNSCILPLCKWSITKSITLVWSVAIFFFFFFGGGGGGDVTMVCLGLYLDNLSYAISKNIILCCGDYCLSKLWIPPIYKTYPLFGTPSYVLLDFADIFFVIHIIICMLYSIKEQARAVWRAAWDIKYDSETSPQFSMTHRSIVNRLTWPHYILSKHDIQRNMLTVRPLSWGVVWYQAILTV